jgi:cell shape-determining protein MreD
MTFPRAVVMVLAAYLGLIVTSSVQALLPWRVPTPELALLVVLYLGLGIRPAVAGGGVGRTGALSGTAPAHVGVALFLGYLADLFAGAPKGLDALALGITMVAARAASSRLDVATPWHTLVIAAAAALAHGLLLLALSSTLYGGEALVALPLVLTTSLTTAVVAPFAFALLARLDRRLQPDPRALRMA